MADVKASEVANGPGRIGFGSPIAARLKELDELKDISPCLTPFVGEDGRVWWLWRDPAKKRVCCSQGHRSPEGALRCRVEFLRNGE